MNQGTGAAQTFVRKYLTVVVAIAFLPAIARDGMAAPLAVEDSLAAPAAAASPPNSPKPDAATRVRINEAYGKLPLSFESNRGQTAEQVKYLARGPGYMLFLAPTEAVLSLRTEQRAMREETSQAKKQDRRADSASRTAVRMKLVGANAHPRIVGVDELPGKSNYFIGNDPKKWRTNIPHYGKVRYREVYPGIDLVFYGNQRQLEYDFVIAPGADLRAITLAFEGADKLEIDADSNLILHLPGGTLIQRAPIVYQEIDGARQAVTGHYFLRDKNRIGVRVAAYDHNRPLIIDPVLIYSTYLGTAGTERGNAIAVDATGNAYVTGSTDSAAFPTTVGAFDVGFNGVVDAFVTKLNAAGSMLVFSTYLGGGGTDRGQGIAVNGVGEAYVTGVTDSAAFPTTAGAFQAALEGLTDAFVTKLNAAGSMLLYSTYLGGSLDDQGNAIAVDTANNAYVTGRTESGGATPFPTTAGAFDTTFGGARDAFVSKFDPTMAGAASLLYSTFLGGTGTDEGFGVAVDTALTAYVTGGTDNAGLTAFPTTGGAFDTTFNGVNDAFVTRLNAAGSMLEYSAFLGGSLADQGNAITVDAARNAYVTGVTASGGATPFPTTAGAFDTTFNGIQDAFVTKVNDTGTMLVYSTFFGGAAEDVGRGIAIDGVGNAYITGDTRSDDLPTAGMLFQAVRAGLQDAFVTKVNAAGTGLVYSTYLGGSQIDIGFGIDVDPLDNAYVTGETASGGVTPFPTTAGAFDTTFNGIIDAFIAKLMESPAAAPGGGGGGGCFVATAAFGSPLAPQVQLLRNFRDQYLLTNGPGQAFTAAYYRMSPPLADLVAKSETARFIVRAGLIPVIGWTTLFMWSPMLGVAIPLVFLGFGTQVALRIARRYRDRK